jgi:hypothetical protein
MNEIIVVVIPTIKPFEEREKIKEVYLKRAGVDCLVFMLYDTVKEGWIKLHNLASSSFEYDWYMYGCDDYFPGQDYLKIALDAGKRTGKKLIAFNDGKWHGNNATVGLVHKSLIDKIPYKSLFNPQYKRHYADPELTAIAKLLNEYHYEPLAVCIEVDYNKDLNKLNCCKEDRELYRRRELINFEVI